MAYDDDEIKRHLKKERARGKKYPGPDPDVLSESLTREAAIEVLLELPDEENFIKQFRRFMIDSGL